MLIRVCLLLLIVGVYVPYADSTETTQDPLFGELDFIFPKDFLSRFPEESQFFTTKILVYLFFNLFAKYVGENEPIKFWSKFNHNDYNRVAIDAVFYEYLTKFADGKIKHLIYDPLESSANSPEDIAIGRIGDYLDNLSSNQVFAILSNARWQGTKIKYYKRHGKKCAAITPQTPAYGIPGRDYPNNCDIPKTSFTCTNKLVPGIYADVETGCQVFHTCWPHRMDSFLCPIGSTFNQILLTCDFWHKSDCSSAPLLFDYSPFQRGTTRINAENTPTMDDETRTTSESPVFSPEMNIPHYGLSCQSLISKPLQVHMKFPPAKCEVTDLKPSTPGENQQVEPTGESSKFGGKRFDRLISDFLSGNFEEMFPSIMKATRVHGGTQRPEMWTTTESEAEAQVTTESPLQNGDLDTTSEQIYSTTTELPYETQDEFPQQLVVEKSALKDASQRKLKFGRTVEKSALLKPSETSEDAIKQVFSTMITSLELGGRILREGLLPLVEKIVVDSRRKKALVKLLNI